MYDMPDEIDVRADGSLRIITLNRPDDLNAVNQGLHSGLARIWDKLNRDSSARAAVITGSGRAFSAGGDFNYIKALSEDGELRAKTLADGRDIVLGMVRCRIPVIAAVNGPAVGLGCSLVALSDVVYIAEDAFLSDPHVQVGLVAADGGPLTWPLHMSSAAGQGVCADRCPYLGREGCRVRSGEPRRQRPGRRGDLLRQGYRRPTAASRREHEANAQHPPGTCGLGGAGLCQHRRGHVIAN